jgi:hypothetical protein
MLTTEGSTRLYVVQLFGIVSGRGLSLGELERGTGAMSSKGPKTAHARGKMRGQVPEATHQQYDQNDPAQFHQSKTP